MITGFNTDIEYDGVVYHVQTEDKGLSTPIILSLVYNGGTILASKRSPYNDLIENFDEAVLSDRLNRQHRLICAAISAGRIDDLKQMAAADRNLAASVTGAAAIEPEKTFAAIGPAVQMHQPDHAGPIPKPFQNGVAGAFDGSMEHFEGGISVLDAEMVIPAEAVEIVSELAESERPVSTRLSVEFIGDSNFKAGERRTVTLMVCRGSERKVVGDAQVMIKILGSSFRPLIFHAKTDKNGIANVNLQLPVFQSGRAAILVRVINDGEEIELRRAIQFG